MIVLAVVAVFLACGMVMHLRGKVRHKLLRQLFDHSTFMAPINVFMLAFSKVPRTPYLPTSTFPELAPLQANWREIREEAIHLQKNMQIKAAANNDDAGFNSFFKSGWKRFYLKWYGDAHPSAMELCPKTTALVKSIPSVKAAMFAELPPGAKLNLHRDPYAGSLRYHLAVLAPNDDRCLIEVDGQPYSWREGEGVIFDETYMHWAENRSEGNRIVLFCDVERPMKGRLSQAVNHWLGEHLVAAASSPNNAGDPTGIISKLFKVSFYAGQYRRRFKAWNPTVYKLTKFGLLAAVVVAFVVW
ncbi:aspartyl/asparaginyl beta-hydroxylase domain-containing protein [Comamonas serinivorans]|nr:aspartyl/asparaginyl beta-hydroxylase domain-containing protein [Comamonas serinivorans]